MSSQDIQLIECFIEKVCECFKDAAYRVLQDHLDTVKSNSQALTISRRSAANEEQNENFCLADMNHAPESFINENQSERISFQIELLSIDQQLLTSE